MFSLRFTVVLVAFLVIPFVISQFGPEPFPAVILPGGADKVPVGASESKYSTTTLYAIGEDGNWGEVNTIALLYPIPNSFQRSILAKEFGLNAKPTEKQGSASALAALKQYISRNKNKTEQEKAEVREWLKTRLVEQGFAASQLKIVKYKVTFAIPSGKTLSKTIADENILYLDR